MRCFAPIVLVVVGSVCGASPARAQFVMGDLYISDLLGDRLYRIEPGSWNVTTFADKSDGLWGPSATLLTPAGTLLCSSGFNFEIFEFDSAGNGTVRYDSTNGLCEPFGENGLAYDAAGDLYVSDFYKQQILRIPAGGGNATVFADFGLFTNSYADGIAFDANGDLYVANRSNYSVAKVDPSGKVTRWDGLPGDPFSLVIRGNGDLYVATKHAPGSPSTIYRYLGGDVTLRTTLASFRKNYGNPSIQLSCDGTKLYYTSYFTANLVEIDADTGAYVEVLPPGTLGNPIAITVLGNAHSASWSNYGAGLAGTFGVPSFTSQQDPILGTTITLDLANSYGQPTTGLLVLGFQKANLHTGLGSDLLLIPTLPFPLSFSYGADSFTGTLPNDPALLGVEVDLQAIEADPGAVKGYSFTQGLELLIGS